MSVQFHNGVILFNGGKIAMHADCCCKPGEDPPIDGCSTNCCSGMLPAKWSVTTSGIAVCPCTQFGTIPQDYSFEFIIDPNRNWVVPHYAGCTWSLVVPDGLKVMRYEWGNGTCSGNLVEESVLDYVVTLSFGGSVVLTIGAATTGTVGDQAVGLFQGIHICSSAQNCLETGFAVNNFVGCGSNTQYATGGSATIEPV